MSRPSAKTAHLKLECRGEMTVTVAPPSSNLPEGLVSIYVYEGRKHYSRQRPAGQKVRVSYQVFSDPLQLADLAERSLHNKSGEAVRGYSTARGGKLVSLGLTDRRMALLVQAAANNKHGRCFEGPLSAHVKLLEQPTPVPARCEACKHLATEHTREEIPNIGDWGPPDERGRHQWDHTLPRVDLRWWCPDQEVQP